MSWKKKTKSHSEHGIFHHQMCFLNHEPIELAKDVLCFQHSKGPGNENRKTELKNSELHEGMFSG